MNVWPWKLKTMALTNCVNKGRKTSFVIVHIRLPYMSILWIMLFLPGAFRDGRAYVRTDRKQGRSNVNTGPWFYTVQPSQLSQGTVASNFSSVWWDLPLNILYGVLKVDVCPRVEAVYDILEIFLLNVDITRSGVRRIFPNVLILFKTVNISVYICLRANN